MLQIHVQSIYGTLRRRVALERLGQLRVLRRNDERPRRRDASPILAILPEWLTATLELRAPAWKSYGGGPMCSQPSRSIWRFFLPKT